MFNVGRRVLFMKVSKAFHKAMNSVFSLLSFNPIISSKGDSGLQAPQNNLIETQDKSKI
jgi:hypothetical protein